jgi:hypothetical protein
LQHTSDFLNDANDYTVCVTDNSGWLYKKSKSKLVSDLGLSTVYKYKGSITWAGLKALESAN